MHSLEQATRISSLYINVFKAEYMYFKPKGVISTLCDKPLKLVDQFTYFGSNILSMEGDVNIRFEKVLYAIDRLSIIWKFNVSDKIKRYIFRAAAVSILL